MWIDPLDGTINFTKGALIGCTTLIGIAIGDRPAFGVIQHIFAPDSPTYWVRHRQGGRGLGVYKTVGNSVEKLEVPQAPDRFVMVSTFYHDSKEVTEFLETIGADEIVRVGGTGYKALMVVLGEVSAYVYASSTTYKWDICGPEAILTALPGGAITDMRGELYPFGASAPHQNSTGIVVSRSPAYHRQVLAAHQRTPFIV